MLKSDFAVRLDDSGVAQIGSSSETRLEWQQISAVYVYKKDCFGLDQIRIALGDEGLRVWIEITEDDEGYQELIAELPRRLPGCFSEKEWWQQVALPSFETQRMRLYQKASGAAGPEVQIESVSN